MDLGLSGKKVVVSAATRGLGRAIARGFLEEGAEVAICGRKPGGGAEHSTGRQGPHHPLGTDGVAEALAYLSDFGTVHGRVADCGYSDQVRDWVEWAAGTMGGLDIAVSNASALGGIPRTREGWDISYNVDLLSSVTIFETALPHMRKAGGGAFVQTSTITAIENHAFGEGGFSYGAMKAALINYVHQLAHEYGGENIRANCVCPGPTFVEDGSWAFLKEVMPDYYAENRDRAPSGRFGRPEEIANVVVFLASPRASWITGENITVDGGFTKNVKY